MDQGPDETAAELPDGFKRHEEPRFGFSVALPERFHLLGNAVDPLARSLRGLDDLPEDEEERQQGRWPTGFWDPEVMGELENGRVQPLRIFECDAIGGRSEPLTQEEADEMWTGVQGFMPSTLEGGGLPGYEYLGTQAVSLGRLPALLFEYGWDGLRPGAFGGDHACVVWAVAPRTILHVYHHCAGEEWDARRPELDAILASFAPLGGEAEADKAGREAE